MEGWDVCAGTVDFQGFMTLNPVGETVLWGNRPSTLNPKPLNKNYEDSRAAGRLDRTVGGT